MNASAVRMAMATDSLTRRSLVKSRSACAMAACVARVVKGGRAPRVTVVSGVHREVPKGVHRLAIRRPLPEGQKVVALALVDLEALQVGLRACAPALAGKGAPALAAVECLGTPKRVLNAWTRTRMEAFPRRSMSPP